MVKIMENPIKMDDLGIPLFSETPNSFLVQFICINLLHYIIDCFLDNISSSYLVVFVII